MSNQSITRTYWLHALSGVHIGAGAGVGIVDQPIIREAVTEWPYVPGSSVKGVLAASHDATEEKREKGSKARAAFGAADSDSEEGSNSGALMFTDARLVCLPVASFFGTFAWTASWLSLRRLSRDLAAAGVTGLPVLPETVPKTAAVPEATVLTESEKIPKAYLRDMDFDVAVSDTAKHWADRIGRSVFAQDKTWASEFAKRFIILSDDAFTHFARHGCEVVTRIKIDPEKRTVEKGKLWMEEMLPAEALLAGLVVADRVFVRGGKVEAKDLMETYCSGAKVLQFGGKATVGRGRVQMRFTGAGQ